MLLSRLIKIPTGLGCFQGPSGPWTMLWNPVWFLTAPPHTFVTNSTGASRLFPAEMQSLHRCSSPPWTIEVMHVHFIVINNAVTRDKEGGVRLCSSNPITEAQE